MNTALQTQEISHDPAPIKLGAAKRVTNESKTKSRSTSAKKKVLLTAAKNSTPKRKTAGNPRAGAKTAYRKMKPNLVNDNHAEQIVVAPQPLASAPDLPIQQEQPVISELATEQTGLSTTDVALEPARIEDHPAIPSDVALENIPSSEFIEPDVMPDSIPFPEFPVFNEPNPCGATAALSEENASTSEVPAPQDSKEIPPTPLTSFWKSMASQLSELWNWAQEKFRTHQVRKRLRVCETVSLGEKRFLAVVQVDGEQFLVGGSSSSVSTLAHLERSREFSDVFQRHCEQDLSQA